MTVLRYRYDASSSDWCFVRLPPSYCTGGASHPWLVCNHGNGWVMDGSERMANFSSKTQYGVDTQRDGYYMRADAPGYRLYSSPTIEAFLAAGYVVCGAQNGGDLLYGNAVSTQACEAFYRHMAASYNVRPRCFMLGASNGFLTTLGAAATLGRERIAGVIGLYPLCNLQHAYTHTHRTGVEQAYGLLAGSLPAQTAAAIVASRNPCTPDFCRRWPSIPALLVWSATDQVLPMEQHAVRFTSLLRTYRPDTTVESVQIDTDADAHVHVHEEALYLHGDWRHFQPERFVDWCNRNPMEPVAIFG